MANITKAEREKRKTKKAILKSIEGLNLTEKYYFDQVDEYMRYYDDLQRINAELSNKFSSELSKEKRQITKEMRNILRFLGLDPGGKKAVDEGIPEL